MFNLDIELKNKRILIIDDLVDARGSLKKMIILLGAVETNIDTCSNGLEATQLITEHDYHIILSDYNLDKGKDGQQVLEEARYTNRLSAASLYIMVTGENALEMVMGALEYEPDSYITKPFTINMLKERLQRILLQKKEFNAINFAVDQGEIGRAIGIAEQLMEQKPNLNLPLTRLLGKLYLRTEEYAKAQVLYENLLDKRSVAWARLGRALCVFKQGDTHTALALLQQTLQKHPLFVQCYDVMAEIYKSLNQYAQAQECLEKAVSISPKAVLRQMELGRVAFANADYPVATKALEQAIKLGRFSCYKNSESYLKFVQASQKQLTKSEDMDHREVRRMTEKARSYTEEVKTDYSEQKQVLFDAAIIETDTHLMFNDAKKAEISIQQAESFLAEVINPNYERQLKMAEAFIKTNQDIKAQTLLNKIKQAASLDDKFKHQIAAMETSLNRGPIEDHINRLNSQGIELYSKGELMNAIIFFDEALAHKEASVSVLMNAIQTKITLMEKKAVSINYLKDCHDYFQRIGVIEADDQRYPRYEQLKNSFTKLWQHVGLN